MAEAPGDKAITACEKHWEANKGDCSAFVRAVANELGIALSGDANSITEQLAASPWQALADGVEAQAKAAQGFFVVGGLKATGHGHVVVVVAGDLNRGKYPTAYWGRLGSSGKKKTTINWAWNQSDRDKVSYAYRTSSEGKK